MFKKFFILSCSVLVASCAATSIPYTGEVENISWPPLGEVNTVSIGDNMINQGHVLKMDALTFKNSEKVTFAYSIPSGSYLKKGSDEGGEYFLITNMEGGQVSRHYGANPVISIYKKKTGQVCLITFIGLKTCNTDSATTSFIKKVSSVQKNGFQQNLLYSGKVGNKIKLSYREFSNDMARQAFSNDAEYDLNESKQIAYKGALIEIIDANNQKITYKVIRNFNISK